MHTVTIPRDAYREARDRIRRAALEARERDRAAARSFRTAYRSMPATVAAELAAEAIR